MPHPSDANVDLLVCDTVRQTPDGKFDLTGFFPTAEVKLDAAVPLPVAVNLTFVFVLKDGDGQFRSRLRIVDPLDRELHRYDYPEFRKTAHQAQVMMFPVERIPIANSGNYSIVLEIDGQPYRRTVRIFQ